MSWFVYVIRVGTEEPRPERQSEIRNHVMQVLQKNEVGCGAGRTSIAIPFHNNLTPEEVEYVAQVLEEGLRTV